ncbi:SH3 domain-containing protein [Seohaeicola zhoushanensis]|uniref:SH3b domain-containing protein n=1 Tax=Seohaeicola zhoushanensis TaxID=1569283 RepID=A0A8J3H2S3_9RHOB|nr:SH3 domain-containing protein [Seohaeicola zhoushanensis]GHF68640.1 hypothetical protein GCM10017056_44740 [Seohaeicola zhoushanensis]
MSRFVLISFAMLGFAGYEMSGGADFKPRPRPEVVVAAAPAPPVTLHVPTTAETLVATQARARLPQNDAASLAQAGANLRQGLPAFPSSAETEVKVASLQDFATPASFGDGTVSAEPAVVRTDAAESTLEEAVAAAIRPTPGPDADLRAISATRVNLRAGPGIDTEILGRLTRGQKVEVLGSDGTGWLRLRTLPDDQVGWIAERLVGPARN